MPTDYNLQAQIAYLSWVAAGDAEIESRIRVVRDYAAGKHPVFLTDRQKEFIGLQSRSATNLFSHNMCALVIDCLVERLEVMGFAAALEGEDGGDLSEQVKVWWEHNRMDAGQDDVYGAAARDGIAYLVVDWDATTGMPVWAINAAYDGTQGVKTYDDPNTGALLFAAKKWQLADPFNSANNGRTRLTLYFPDRIEKYISTRGSNAGVGGTIWEPWQDAGDTTWPIVWKNEQGPLGMAVIPFANPGGSEIEQIIHIQDALNKADVDLLATSDAAGFRILYAAGVTGSIDPATGKEKSLTISPGQMLKIADPAGRLGAIEPVDPALLIRASKYWIEVIAGLSRTPQYLFQAMGGDQPSGASLKEQEIGLVYKAERRQRLWGNAWEDAITLSARLHNLNRPGEQLGIVRMSAQWKAATTPSDPVAQRLVEGQAREAQVKSGLPLKTALRIEGWSDEELAQMATDKATEDTDSANSLGAAMAEAARRSAQGGEI